MLMSFREIVAADGSSSIIGVKELAQVTFFFSFARCPRLRRRMSGRGVRNRGEQMMRVTVRALAISLAKLTRSGFLGLRQAARNDFPSCYHCGRTARRLPGGTNRFFAIRIPRPMYANSGNTGHHHSSQIVINWSYRGPFKESSSFSLSFFEPSFVRIRRSKFWDR